MTPKANDFSDYEDKEGLVATKLAANSFKHFFHQAWQVIEPGTQFTPNWHIDAECEHAQAVSDGKIHNLIVNQPPRTLKSTIWSVAWPAWVWITNPKMRWLFASYDIALSVRDSIGCRRLIESPWYQKRWGNVYKLTGDQNVKGHYDNDKGGRRVSTSVDAGKSTGWGGGILVFDDPNKANEGDAIRAHTNEWMDQTMSSRLDDQRTGSRVIIQQRTNEDDVSGHLLLKGGYDHLLIRMEFEGPTKPTTTGWVDPRTKYGELLYSGENPRVGPAQVAEFKRDLGSYGFAGQYQQRPSPAEGGILKRYWFRFWCHTHQPLPPFKVRQKNGQYDDVYALPLPPMDEEALSFDCAFKSTDTSDFVAAGHWGRRGADKFLLDLVNERLTFTETVDAVKKMTTAAPRATLKLIEAKANGDAVIDTLRSTITGIVGVEPRGGKMARVQSVSPQIEAGNVYLPHPVIAPWVDSFLDQCASFPNGAHDDMVDQMSQMLLRWQTHSGIFHTSEQSVICQPINIPPTWKRGAAMVIRNDKVSVIWAATDPATGFIYLTTEYVKAGVDPLYHASTITGVGKWMPVTISTPLLSQEDGRKVAQRYRTLGVRCMDSPGEPEAFLQDLTQAMGQGRFKVFSQLQQWIEQFRLAGNQQDKAIDITGDLIRASCLLYGSRERMAVQSNFNRPKADGLPRPLGPPESIGITWG